MRSVILNIVRITYILTFTFYGCDTAENIDPKSEDTFLRIFGGEFQDKGIGITALPDNRLAILASTTENVVTTGQEPIKDVVIILTDSSGSNSEVFIMGNPDVNESPSGMVFYEDNLYVGGTTDINGDNDFLLMKFSLSSKSILTYLPIGQADTSEICHDIGIFENTTAGTGIIMVGEIGINDTTQSFDTWLSLNGDSIGALIPSARFDGRSISVAPLDQNYYLVLGEDQSQGLNTQIMKLSRVQYSNGVTGDSKDITGEGEYFKATKVLLVSQNVVLANGYETASGISTGSSGVVISENQTGPNFPEIPGKGFVFLDGLRMITTDIIKSIDGGYLLLGTDPEMKVIKLVKLNLGLDIIEWSEDFGTNGELDEAGSICQFPDGKIFFTASVSYQIGGTNTKIALYKTSADGKLDY